MDPDTSIKFGDGGGSEEMRPKMGGMGRSEEKGCYAVSSKQSK